MEATERCGRSEGQGRGKLASMWFRGPLEGRSLGSQPQGNPRFSDSRANKQTRGFFPEGMKHYYITEEPQRLRGNPFFRLK